MNCCKVSNTSKSNAEKAMPKVSFKTKKEKSFFRDFCSSLEADLQAKQKSLVPSPF